MSKAESRDLSLNVLHLLPGFLQALIPDEETLLHLLRKAAHFTEFACLGGLSAGLLALFRKVSFHPVAHLFCGGFFVAAIDETIQIFTNRGSQLQDVWLDFAGFSAGLVLVLVVRTTSPAGSPRGRLRSLVRRTSSLFRKSRRGGIGRQSDGQNLLLLQERQTPQPAVHGCLPAIPHHKETTLRHNQDPAGARQRSFTEMLPLLSSK